MTTTEIALHQSRNQDGALPAKVRYAHELATSGLLPAAYRKNPGNILYAIEYGEMLGLAPMAAITGVHVIEGKPTASAGLISALVRRAGHQLRVKGDTKSATCQIIRADDPRYTFTVTFTIDDAKTAGLLSKDVWRKYPASMLKSRAITQCARDACEEALFGLHYTPEELGAEVDEDGDVIGPASGEPAQEPAARSNGTPQDDPWYVRPAPQDQPDAPAGGTRPWAEAALAQAKAGTFKTEAGAWALWREAAEPGKCTPGQKDEIQNILAAWVRKHRRKASDMILQQLPEAAADWKAAVEGLNGDDIESCRELLEEIGRLKAAGTMNETLAGRIAGAIIALCPKAVIKGGDTDG